MRLPLAATLLIAFAAAFPRGALAGEGLAGSIDSALDRGCLNADKTAVRVVNARTGEVLYDRNGGAPLVPASVMKLVTTASALHYLGPAYRFKTDILHTGVFENGVIDGDIIIRGRGDPKLTPENLWGIAKELKRRGLIEITGDLVVDDSFFDGRRRAPSWRARRTQRPYDAKLGALSVNFNTVAAHVFPGEAPGYPLIVSLEPESAYLTLVNKGKTTSGGKNRLSVRRVKDGNAARLVVSGSMRVGSEGRVVYVNIDDPLMFAAEAFRSSFENAGIKISGRAREGETTEDAGILFTHESEPLAVILRQLNRHSSNFVAEQIVKTIAAEANGEPGAHEKALRMTSDFMEELGVDMTGVVLADGSGLSRRNRLTARAMTDLLTAVRRRFDIGPDFVASLGIMGVDGSVRKRLKNSSARALARAKTGTLARVSSLAGYVAGQGGRVYAFAILSNDNSCYYKKADSIEDKVVTAVHLFDPAAP